MSYTVLIVDDEADIVETLEYNLQREGYKTRSAFTGNDALIEIAKQPGPDLVILDLMLPDLSGTEICRRIREDTTTQSLPVIMLTARSDEIDRVVGFQLGADDYVFKPFSVRELLLRIQAVLRRTHGATVTAKEDSVTFGCLKVETSAHRVWVDENEVRVTALEFRLLETFLERKGRVQSRVTLLVDVWGYDAAVTTRTVDTHINRLREKLGKAGGYIETIRGVGYRFATNP